MRRLQASVLAAACGLALVAGSARRAEARIVDLRAGANAGGMVGWGTTPNTPDFFHQASGPGFGFELGARLLVFDLSADFLQIVKSGGLDGTLLQFLLGTEFDIPVGHDRLPNGQHQNIVRPGIAAGFGFGTGAPVQLPYSGDQLSDKGIVSRVRVAWEYFLNPFMGVGAEGDFGYHYFLGGEVINDSSKHSSGYHLMGLATFTFHLGY